MSTVVGAVADAGLQRPSLRNGPRPTRVGVGHARFDDEEVPMAVKNEKQYEALKDKGMSKERAAKIANSPDASKHGGQKSGSGGDSTQGPYPEPVTRRWRYPRTRSSSC